MKQKFPSYLFIVLAFVLCSCNRSLAPGEYVKYVENPENGLLVKGNANGIRYSLQYQPTEYLVMLQLKSFNIPPDQFNEQYSRFKGIEHYVLRIYKHDMDSLVSKATDSAKVRKGMTEYLDFGIQKDFKMVVGNDTIPCGISECESSMGMLPYYSFVLGFPIKEKAGDREFLYGNKMIGTGDVKLLIKEKSIRGIPKLKMNNG